jgi:hypothetical protein
MENAGMKGNKFANVERFDVRHDGVTVWVVGAQRTGSHWLAWLLGDVLNSPVRGDVDWAKDFARDGLDRPGQYLVRTSNRKPWCEGPMILIVRDPRDAVVSAMNYWNASFEKRWPRVSGWNKFYKKLSKEAAAIVRYEDLLADCEKETLRILQEANLEYDPERIGGGCWRQRFDAKKRWPGEGRKPGEKFFWKGKVGTWKGVLTPGQVRTVETTLAELMEKFGYG